MDVSIFSRTIKELILENDRVGVPEVGHFVAEMMPASFSDRRTMINPPYRRMSFSKKDEVTAAEKDLFLNKLEELSGLPTAEVVEKYDNFIKGFISNLESEKVIDMPSLGRMHATSNNEYFFVADEDLDIYPDGIGLTPVSVKAPDPEFVPVAPPETEKESETEVEQEPLAESDIETQTEQELESKPQTESEPVEVAVIDPEAIEDNEFVGEPEAEKESEPEMEPVPEPDAEPASETLSDPKFGHEQDSSDLVFEPSKKRVGLWVIVTIIALVIVVALLIYYFKDSEWLSPILDKLLYTKEELRILGR
jgi:hypothetical protein